MRIFFIFLRIDQRIVAFGAYIMKMALTLGQHHLLKSPLLRLMAHTSKRDMHLNCYPNCHSLLQAQIIKTSASICRQ